MKRSSGLPSQNRLVLGTYVLQQMLGEFCPVMSAMRCAAFIQIILPVRQKVPEIFKLKWFRKGLRKDMCVEMSLR